MKIVAVNGGPRRGKNTDQMLDAFIQGVHDAAPEAEVQVIRLYDYIFTGCKSCFACQLKKNRDDLQCWLKDDMTQLLKDTYRADGIVFASPIYYCNVSAQLRAFWERLMYPGPSSRTVQTALILTGNVDEEGFRKFMGAPFDINNMYLKSCFHAEPQTVLAGDTFQYNEKEIYNDAFRAPAGRKLQRREQQYPLDLEKARQAGVHMVQEIIQQAKSS